MEWDDGGSLQAEQLGGKRSTDMRRKCYWRYPYLAVVLDYMEGTLTLLSKVSSIL